jgi:hypothetical protein
MKKMKSKLLFSVVLGLCLAMSSAMNVFAEKGIIEKQREVDQFIFEDHSTEIAELGITVTHTSPGENIIEIGIVPFSEENANYFYEAFGEENVKVVEGEQMVTLSTGGKSLNEPSEAMLEKQREIDAYFAEHEEELTEKGITFTHSSPMENYVEVGITPFNEENADYLYDIFGVEQVKIVEGQLAHTMSLTSEPTESSASNMTYLYIVLAIVAAGGLIFVLRRDKGAKA